MKHVARYSTLLTLLAACGIGTAHGQTAIPDRGYGEFTVGPTFGHKSSSSIGGEVGDTLNEALQAILEGGRMANVATTDVDARAQIIGNAIGASVSTVQRAAYFDIGAKYRILKEYGRWRPYVLLGVGAAGVKTTADFAINGNDVTGQLDQFGVQLGRDLSGSLT